MEWKKNIVIGLLLLCVGGLLSMMLTKSCQNQTVITTEIVKTDTLTIAKVDTITIEKPVPYKVIERDTIYITDTLVGSYFVHEVKEYIHPTFYAKISGVNAKLNEIKVYPKTVTKYITTTEKVYQEPKKWGVLVGVEYEPIPKNFIRLFGEIDYSDIKNIFFLQGGNELMNKNWFVKVGYKRTLIQF